METVAVRGTDLHFMAPLVATSSQNGVGMYAASAICQSEIQISKISENCSNNGFGGVV